MIIYKATNKINGKIYIGQTIGKLQKRINEHKCNSRKSKLLFGRAIKKYGFDSFEWEIIGRASTRDKLDYMEIKAISYYNTFYGDGYNMCEGGSSRRGYKHSEEIKKKFTPEKMRRKTTQLMINRVKEVHTGKFVSEETRLKQSKSQLGKVTSCEIRKKISNKTKGRLAWNKGKKPTIKVINIETGEIFQSISAAGKSINMNSSILGRRLKGKTKNRTQMRYLDD